VDQVLLLERYTAYKMKSSWVFYCLVLYDSKDMKLNMLNK